eukprot:748411-Hanusia_phi.AAC.1
MRLDPSHVYEGDEERYEAGPGVRVARARSQGCQAARLRTRYGTRDSDAGYLGPARCGALAPGGPVRRRVRARPARPGQARPAGPGAASSSEFNG